MGRLLLRFLYCCMLIVAVIFTSSTVRAQADYNIGTVTVKEIWVDPVNGKDVNNGTTRALAYKTLNFAMANVPSLTPFTTTGYKIMLVGGAYPSDDSPPTYSSYQGTAKYPVIIQAADGAGTVKLPSMSVSDCSYFYLIDLNIETTIGSDAIGCSGSNHLLIRHCTINGQDSAKILLSQNVVSVSGSQYCYIEDCIIINAYGANLYISGSQHCQIVRSTLQYSSADGVAIDYGSADIWFARNTIRNTIKNAVYVGSNGVSTLDAFSLPWAHYDAYAVRIVNNIISDCDSSAFVCNGGYDVLFAHNTLYKIGGFAPSLISLGLGKRACSGLDQQVICKPYLDSGAWGTVHIYNTDDDVAWIPNTHLYIYNNVFYNPTGYETTSSQFVFDMPKQALQHASCPKPANTDNDLQIKGNIIWNGTLAKPLGITATSGAQPSNPTCNATLLNSGNSIHKQEPLLANPDNGDFHPATGGAIVTTSIFPIPDFIWSDLPSKPKEPLVGLSNIIATDFEGASRTNVFIPGAFTSSKNDVRTTTAPVFVVGNPTPNPSSVSCHVTASITEHSMLDVAVYDLLGRKISTLASGYYDIGSYTINCETASLRNGVYYIRFEAQGQVVAKQLVVSQ